MTRRKLTAKQITERAALDAAVEAAAGDREAYKAAYNARADWIAANDPPKRGNLRTRVGQRAAAERKVERQILARRTAAPVALSAATHDVCWETLPDGSAPIRLSFSIRCF